MAEGNSTEDNSFAREMDKKIEEMNATVKERFDSRLQSTRDEVSAMLEHSIGQKMASASSSYQAKRRDQVNAKQTDIMRVNKIFRDVARVLGENWRPVFVQLTSELPEVTVSRELSKIEQQKATLQAYKSLTTWKDLVGGSFNMNSLIRALEKNGLHDLADMVLATMQAENMEDLLSKEDLGKGKGIVSGVRRGSASEKGGDDDAVKTDKPVLLDDARLLRLAKGVGGSWVDFARALQAPDDEVQEILQTEGMSYQGCFRILWFWRDRREDNILSDNHAVLEGALTKIGREDLVKLLQK